MRLLIIGGVAGGMSAATRARRLDESAEIIVFEMGRHVSFANCGLPYFIGGTISDRAKLLVQTPERLRERFNIDVRTRSQVTAIDRQARTVTVQDLDSGSTYVETYDKLVLAPGAQCVRPRIPGVDDPAVQCLRDLDDMDQIGAHVDAAADPPDCADAAKTQAGRAVVIGGGFIGIEMAENLIERGLNVAVVEMLPQVMPTLDLEMTTPIRHHLSQKGVALFLSNPVAAIERNGQGALCVRLRDGRGLACDFAVLAVGVRPNTELARAAGLEMGETGGIKVDEHMRTSDPDVYAVGDAVEVLDYVLGGPVLVPLAGPANRQGRIAADNMLGRSSTFRGVQGTAICKVFDLTAASTGPNEKTLQRLGIPHEKVYVHPGSHAGYYPGAATMAVKLLFSTSDGRVLGAQVVGRKGVDKRIDVLATTIQARMTVYNLEQAELAYAPPYGAAKDPINMAGFVAANHLRGDVDIIHAEDLDGTATVLDVRTKSEFDEGHIPGSLHIPLDDLRQRLGEVPRGGKLAVCCGVGLRAYVACRILKQNGFDAANIPGGFTTYCHYHPEDERECAELKSAAEREAAFWAGVE